MTSDQYRKEVNEAISAADLALECLNRAKNDINSASSWGILDMLGGGFLTTLIKHDRMNKAKNDMEDARAALRKFSRELSDVDQYIDVDVDTDNFISFADYFFDGLVVDWFVQDRIGKAKEQIDDAICKVTTVREQLTGIYS